MTLSPPVYHAPSSEAESLRVARYSEDEVTVELESGKRVTGRVTFFSEDRYRIRATMEVAGIASGVVIAINKERVSIGDIIDSQYP
ncbi:MAG: hypothetical protein Q4A34_01545 [Candidatus Saccharibacteria bacterium]|nr:hypothetical protein [Candidatus Saccharibacteria bacterium]